ncbi:MAG: MerR family transcriptional regulator [Alphaproteobacteria bacterium]|nr:MerR family transcriptional regulator [Alphaproteobacteria bacterium]
MGDMTIGAAAKAAGVGIETIRFYERRGLIPQPIKPERGYRTYPAEVIGRVRFIREAQSLGFSLREAAELLALQADPAADSGEVRERAAAKIGEIGEKIARLERIRGALGALIAACPGSGPLGDCSIMMAMLGDGLSSEEV